jgi:hypothetical protein
VLAGAVVVLDGHGLGLGFWFDDHNHLELGVEQGYRGLGSGNAFDWTGRIARVWWAAKPTGWAYFRPLTVALRVTLLRVSGLNPVPFHLVHLGTYAASVGLLYGLVRRCGAAPGAALTASLLCTLHPTHAFTAVWLANDGSVLVGLWTLLGLLAVEASARAGHGRRRWVAAAALCYALGLLSRENGIMLGPMLVLFDALRWWRPAGVSLRRPWAVPDRRRLALYAILTLEGLVYLPVRGYFVRGAPLPRSPYFHWPTEPGFLSWLPYKLLNDAICLPLGLPFVPITDVAWWRGRPLAAAAAALGLLFLAVLMLVPLRRSRAAWGLVVGMVMAAAPTLLVFSAPYNYYVVAAGWAVLVALWSQRVGPSRPRLVAGVNLALAVGYLAGSWGAAWVLHSSASVERLVLHDVLRTDPGTYPPDTRLFFINMPFLAAEVGPAIRLASGRADLSVYPLTYASELFLPRGRVHVHQEDERTLLVTHPGQGWFRGPFGDLVQLGWFGASRSELSGGPVPIRPEAGPMPFRVELVRRDAEAVSALRFIFDDPLHDPRNRFFVGSQVRLARPQRFGLPTAPAPSTRPASTSTSLHAPESIEMAERRIRRLRRMQRAFEAFESVL